MYSYGTRTLRADSRSAHLHLQMRNAAIFALMAYQTLKTLRIRTCKCKKIDGKYHSRSIVLHLQMPIAELLQTRQRSLYGAT